MTSGTGLVGMSNRGLGHEGLVFEASKEYTGYFFAKSAKAVTFTVAILDYVGGNKTLASAEIKFAGGNWTVRGRPGRVSALSVLHSKSVFPGAFV